MWTFRWPSWKNGKRSAASGKSAGRSTSSNCLFTCLNTQMNVSFIFCGSLAPVLDVEPSRFLFQPDSRRFILP